MITESEAAGKGFLAFFRLRRRPAGGGTMVEQENGVADLRFEI